MQVLPLTAKLAGAVLLVSLAVNPMVTVPDGAIVALYDAALTVTCSPDWV